MSLNPQPNVTYSAEMYGDAKKRIATLEAEVARLKEERTGNWMDKLGACKVCDGEIPHGHSGNCDVWRLEKQVTALREHNAKLRRAAEYTVITGEGLTELYEAISLKEPT